MNFSSLTCVQYGEVRVAVGTTVLDVLASTHIKSLTIIILDLVLSFIFLALRKKHAAAPNLLPKYTKTHDFMNLQICRPQSL